MSRYSTTRGYKSGARPILSTWPINNLIKIQNSNPVIREYFTVARKRVFVVFRSPRRFDTTGEMLAIRPIAAIINVINIAVATLIAPSVTVECLPATTTSPTFISILARFPAIIGAESFIKSFA